MTLEEIKAKYSELNHQDCALRSKMRELEEQKREIFKEQAKENIGRCFIIDNKTYVKVINIPQEAWYKSGINFNEYQYPALYIKPGHNVPFEEDDLFSGAWGVGSDPFKTEYKEITQEEFNQKFEEVLEDFKNRAENFPFEIRKEKPPMRVVVSEQSTNKNVMGGTQ